MDFKKKLHKALCITLIAVFALSLTTVFAVDSSDVEIKLQIDNPVMTVNGTETEIDPGRGTVPVINQGRTLVPIRAIIEALGGTVGWDGEKSEVTLNVGDDEIKLVIDSKNAFLNGKKSILDVAPTTINDRTMLPIRYVAESFKFEVQWDESTNTVTIIKGSTQTIIEIFDNLGPGNEETEDDTDVSSPYDGERLVDDGMDFSQSTEEETEEEDPYAGYYDAEFAG